MIKEVQRTNGNVAAAFKKVRGLNYLEYTKEGRKTIEEEDSDEDEYESESDKSDEK